MMSYSSGSPRYLVFSLVRYRSLIWEIAKRDFYLRYRGSIIGFLWSFVHPLLMLGIYSFTFSFIFKPRWLTAENGILQYIIMLFAGLIVYGLFSDCVNKAPSLITNNPNYVKKVVFPLEILSPSVICAALMRFAASFVILLLFCVLGGLGINMAMLLVPLIIMPVVFLTLGVSWILSSLGVYIRDISQGIGVLTTIFLFLSPVFYPVSAVPSSLIKYLYLNPLTIPIDQLRAVIVHGEINDWYLLLIDTVVCGLMTCAGFFWFQKTRRGFADVV